MITFVSFCILILNICYQTAVTVPVIGDSVVGRRFGRDKSSRLGLGFMIPPRNTDNTERCQPPDGAQPYDGHTARFAKHDIKMASAHPFPPPPAKWCCRSVPATRPNAKRRALQTPSDMRLYRCSIVPSLI